jgi:hypothetical protein
MAETALHLATAVEIVRMAEVEVEVAAATKANWRNPSFQVASHSLLGSHPDLERD